MAVTVECNECGKTFSIPVRDGDLERWRSGGLIQNVMPYLAKDQRELLISQTCGPCFEELFEILDSDGAARGEDDDAPAFELRGPWRSKWAGQ